VSVRSTRVYEGEISTHDFDHFPPPPKALDHILHLGLEMSVTEISGRFVECVSKANLAVVASAEAELSALRAGFARLRLAFLHFRSGEESCDQDKERGEAKLHGGGVESDNL
jgi:hypothetical protein